MMNNKRNAKRNSHLNSINKSYLAHMRGALKTCFQCFVAGISVFIHGLLPFLFETTASDIIKDMYERQNKKGPQ